MKKPYQVEIVLTEHVAEVEKDICADVRDTDFMFAHIQKVHDNLLDPVKQTVGCGELSPMRTIQLLSTVIAGMIRKIGVVDTPLASMLVEAVCGTVRPDEDEEPEASMSSAVEREWEDHLTPEQKTQLAAIAHNPAFKAKQ